MDQIGKIVELIDESTAKILMTKHTDCGKCGACDLGKDMDMMTIAQNDVNAKVGDMVQVSMETKNILSAAFIMYVIPLIALLTGIILGSKLFSGDKSEVMALFFGFLLLAITYFLIKLNEKRYTKKYKAVITKIIKF